MSSVALIIIYNHKYDQNIPVLEKLYSSRFKHIYHLVPFYTGEKENVIPVYENSFYFQGYVAQGLKSYYSTVYAHYIFIADDMVLNPLINENNYREQFNLTADACFLPERISLHECNKGKHRWERVKEALHFKHNNILGLEIQNELPDYVSAIKLFAKHGLTVNSFQYEQIATPILKPNWYEVKKLKSYYMEELRKKIYKNTAFNLQYPLLGSYSDIFVVSGNVVRSFAHYCGVFATNKLFVEFAIPTAMVFSADIIIYGGQLKLQPRPLWTKDDFKILDQYHFNLENLLQFFPKNLLFLHPVKLSKWH